MATSPNDVNILTVATADTDHRVGDPLEVRVRGEVGNSLHGAGAKYRVAMTVTDETSLQPVDTQNTPGNYGDANWPNPGPQTFTYTVPAASLAGREGHILRLQANVIGNQSAPFDASHQIGETVLITP
jgi:hypothetical protein